MSAVELHEVTPALEPILGRSDVRSFDLVLLRGIA
jgi:hypothetical protein